MSNFEAYLAETQNYMDVLDVCMGAGEELARDRQAAEEALLGNLNELAAARNWQPTYLLKLSREVIFDYSFAQLEINGLEAEFGEAFRELEGR